MSLEHMGSTVPLQSFVRSVPRVDYVRMAQDYERTQPEKIPQIPKALETYARARTSGAMKRNMAISTLLADWINRAWRILDLNSNNLRWFHQAIEECEQKGFHNEADIFQNVAARFAGNPIPETYKVAVQAREMDRKDRERAEREKYGKGL